VGVFVNAPVTGIVSLYHDNVIAIAQLHGTEDETYISDLKAASAAGGREAIPIIKTITITSSGSNSIDTPPPPPSPDYYLIDSGAGSGQAFNWDTLNHHQFSKPWFLAGGINIHNLKQAMALKPYAIDISSGAETNGVKDRTKMLQLASIIKEGGK
jgi:phosphoribosylanthranilate isomerase